MMDFIKPLFVILFFVSAAAQGCCQSDRFELLTTRHQVTDYYIGYEALGVETETMDAVTACAWFRTTARTPTMTIISYAVSDEADNELWLGLDESALTWYFGKEKGTSHSMSLFRDGRWHHTCGTWEGRGGQWAIYVDGFNAGSGTGSLDNENYIRGGGILVIGQDQDTLGGDFDSQQSFVGALTDVNIFNRTLTRYELGVLATGCTAEQGNVFNWNDVRGGLRGNIQVLPSSMPVFTCNAHGNPHLFRH